MKQPKPELDLTAEQWVDLIRVDGESFPACCANLSAIRDELISVLRNGKPFVMYQWSAERVLVNLAGHQDDLGLAFQPNYQPKNAFDPWPKVAEFCLKSAGYASLEEFQKANK